MVLAFFFQDKKRITKLKRPDYGEGQKTYEVVVEKDGASSEIAINVGAKELSESELQRYFDECFEIVSNTILGKNKSFKEINSDLVFQESIGIYGMKAQYFVDDSGLINYFGEVNNKGLEESKEAIVTVQIIYKEFSQDYKIPLLILPKELSAEEKMKKQIEDKINSQSINEDYVELPENIESERLSYYEKNMGIGPLILLVLITGAVVIYYSKYYRPKIERENRNKELIEDYSEIVSKLSLLMGAGMSTYNALSKIGQDFFSTNKKNRCAYDEIKRCVNQIASGTMETVAYKEFGKRCGVNSYIKLSGLLVQNIKKGSGDILSELKCEVEDAFEERKCKARKAGEIVSTKLLFPMILQLTVVLIIIMIPAFR